TTIIDGNQSGSVVTFINGEDSTAVLTGFTIQNGLASYGGGIRPDHSDPTLDNLIIQNNTATSSGGGISFYYSRSNLINSIVRNNHADYNGGGLALAHEPVKIINTLIINNTCTNNGAGINVYNENHEIANCTIVGNSPDGLGGGIRLAQDAHVVLLNSIIHSNENGNIRLKPNSNAPKSITISYSDIQGGQESIVTNDSGTVTWGSGNIDVNPMFVDAANGDYLLSDTSPCISAGTASITIEGVTYTAPTTDITGVPDSRPSPAGTIPDMGAYENSNGVASYSGDTYYVSASSNYGNGSSTYPF
ncbi:uncharacterized protein METZ01_LOCUS371090, partial [marine metagenome]